MPTSRPTKCYLLSLIEKGSGNDYAYWRRLQGDAYVVAGIERLKEAVNRERSSAEHSDTNSYCVWQARQPYSARGYARLPLSRLRLQPLPQPLAARFYRPRRTSSTPTMNNITPTTIAQRTMRSRFPLIDVIVVGLLKRTLCIRRNQDAIPPSQSGVKGTR